MVILSMLQDADVGESRAKRAKLTDNRSAAASSGSSRDRKRDRDKEGSQADAAGSKLARANDGAPVQPSASVLLAGLAF